MRNKIEWFCAVFAILALIPGYVVYARTRSGQMAEPGAVEMALSGASVEPGLGPARESSSADICLRPKVRVYVGRDAGEVFPLRRYVTPEDDAIKALSARISGARDAYEVAVQWPSVSDRKLNLVPDRWLTPHEFLAETPDHPNNPVRGKAVGDCEEKAHTLVSLLRAEGIRPEEVRVVLGEVNFCHALTGHAWVELQISGRWVALEPSSGPYWDDNARKLVHRRGIPFDYYLTHSYPAVRVWSYYNDVYYQDCLATYPPAPFPW